MPISEEPATTERTGGAALKLQPTNTPIQLRSVGRSLTEVLLLCLAALVWTALLIITIGHNHVGFLTHFIRAADTTTYKNIGWAFGVYVPTLLGFYVLIVGGQLVHSTRDPLQTQRALGEVAELLTAALTPALVLAFCACISSPKRAGALFVMAPASATVVFLTVQLSQFVIPGRERRLAAARESHAWAQGRLDHLQEIERRSMWWVLPVNILGPIAIDAFAVVLGGGTLHLVWLTEELGLTAYTVLIGVGVIVILYLARDWAARTTAGVTLVALYPWPLLIVIDMFSTRSPYAATANALGLLGIIASSILPPHIAPARVSRWTLRSGSASIAVRLATRMLKRAGGQIQSLEQVPQGE